MIYHRNGNLVSGCEMQIAKDGIRLLWRGEGAIDESDPISQRDVSELDDLCQETGEYEEVEIPPADGRDIQWDDPSYEGPYDRDEEDAIPWVVDWMSAVGLDPDGVYWCSSVSVPARLVPHATPVEYLDHADPWMQRGRLSPERYERERQEEKEAAELDRREWERCQGLVSEDP